MVIIGIDPGLTDVVSTKLVSSSVSRSNAGKQKVETVEIFSAESGQKIINSKEERHGNGSTDD
jgi:hypothetical protein